MEPGETLYKDLPVSVRLNSSGDYYEFFVTLDGAPVTFYARKTGGINDDITRAKAKAAEDAKNAPAPEAPAAPAAESA